MRPFLRLGSPAKIPAQSGSLKQAPTEKLLCVGAWRTPKLQNGEGARGTATGRRLRGCSRCEPDLLHIGRAGTVQVSSLATCPREPRFACIEPYRCLWYIRRLPLFESTPAGQEGVFHGFDPKLRRRFTYDGDGYPLTAAPAANSKITTHGTFLLRQQTALLFRSIGCIIAA